MNPKYWTEAEKKGAFKGSKAASPTLFLATSA